MSRKRKKNISNKKFLFFAIFVTVVGLILATFYSQKKQDVKSQASTEPNIPGRMFIATEELMTKPTSGPGWDYLKSRADLAWPTANLGDQFSVTQTDVLAAALVYARDPIVNASYKNKVITQLKQVCGTEKNAAQLLNLARTLYGYVVSADMVQMDYSTQCDNGETWLAFLSRIRTESIPGNSRWPTLEITSADTSSNWGAYSLSSHLAVSYALNDTVAIQRDIDIFERFLGDTSSPASPFNATSSYRYNNDGTTWDMAPTLQRGINPCTTSGNTTNDCASPDARSGALIEDALRGAEGIATPPGISFTAWQTGFNSDTNATTNYDPSQGYQEETMDGIFSTAQLLRVHGSDYAHFQGDAMLRAFKFWKMHNSSHWGAAYWKYLPYYVNYLYGTSYPVAGESATPYRHMGYGSWLFTGTIPTLITSVTTPTTTIVLPTSTIIPPTPTIFFDSTKPSVIIVSPSNGSTVSRGSNVTITASASDNIGVTKVLFYGGTTLKCTDTTYPYTCNWNIPSKPNMTYALKAVAYDAANNSSSSIVSVITR